MAKSYVCFDIGSTNLKMVELSGDSGSVQLNNFATAPLDFRPDMTNDEKDMMVARTVRSILDEKKIKTKTISISISGQSVFTRFVQLPAVDESKVAQIIKYEAQQQVPFPIDEVEWDYQIIGGSGEEEINVVLVAIKKEIVMGLVTAIEKVGCEVGTVSVAPLSIYNCTAYNEDLYSGAIAVIDLGANTTSLIVCDGDRLWSRNIPIGSDNITQTIAKEMNLEPAEAEQLKRESYIELDSTEKPGQDVEPRRQAAWLNTGVCKRLTTEIRRSIGFYRTQSKGTSIQRVLLSGGGLLLTNLHEYFEAALKVPLERMFPLKKLSISPSIDRGELNTHTHTLCDAIGLGLRMLGKSRLSVNLLPKIIAYRKELSKKKVFIVGAVICLIATMLAFAMNYKRIRQDVYEQSIRTLDERITRLRPFKEKVQRVKQEIEGLGGKLNNIKKLQNARLYWVEFIDALKNKKPKYTWFTEIKVGGVERTTGGFTSDYARGAYGGGSPYGSPYGSSPYGSSPYGSSPYGRPPAGGGRAAYNPYARDSSVEGEKGYIELTGYLKMKKVPFGPEDLAEEIEVLKQTLENVEDKDKLELAWRDFKNISLPKKPNENKLRIIYRALQSRVDELEMQVKDYLEQGIIPKNFITKNALDGILVSAGRELQQKHQEDYKKLKEYSKHFEGILAQFNDTAKSDFFGDIVPKKSDPLEFYPGVAKFVFKAKLNRSIEF